MNQKQREFLIKHIEKQHAATVQRLKDSKPIEPNLNNYIVAAILDGSFELKDRDSLKAFIRQKALALGPSATLVDRKHNYRRDEDEQFEVSLAADALFVLPAAYQSALARYQEALQTWKTEMAQADAVKDTLLLKIQIGSDKVLARLIEQADNLADLHLVNAQLLLAGGQD